MRTVLLPFCDDEASEHACAVAARLVGKSEGYVEGLFVLRRPGILDGDGAMLADGHVTQLIEECRAMADRAQERFRACVAGHGLTLQEAATGQGPGAGWREIEGTEQQVIGSHGRLFELIVVGRDFGGGWLNWRSIVESALFEGGRPVLLVPDAQVATMGENVLIAWNPSTETARTVALAMPLLVRARSVTVLSVEDWGVPGPSGDELAAYLRRAGVPASARTVQQKERSPAQAVLDECRASGVDLLVKGAYTQSRLRQMIFGGATRDIIAQAHIPVVLSN